MQSELFKSICSIGEPKDILLFGEEEYAACKTLSNELSISILKANILIIVFLIQLSKKGNVNAETIKQDFNLDNYHYGILLKNIIELKEEGYLEVETELSSFMGNAYGLYPDISLSDVFLSYVLKGEKIETLKLDYNKPLSIIEKAGEYIMLMKRGRINSSLCLSKISNIFAESPKKSIFYQMYKKYTKFELALFMFASANYFEKNVFGSAENICDDIFDSFSDKTHYLMLIQSEKLSIISDGLVKIDAGTIIDDPNITIEHKTAKNVYEVMVNGLVNGKLEYANVLKYDKLKQRLFYDKKMLTNIKDILSVLSPKNYNTIISKLKEYHMSSSINILFYGPPGTGKTALVYHLAYLTKRDIFEVNIADIKDKYVGNSEKRVKGIFDEYKRESESSENKPILLFNEADALIGNRVEVSQSVDQMYNSMQNILLSEMEKFNGVLVATTNLVDNFDDAFARRFLFKLNFSNPSERTRREIWASKINKIPNEILNKLGRLELSGGEIENVAKKFLLKNILKTNEDYSIILKLAEDELSFKKEDRKVMGFTK